MLNNTRTKKLLYFAIPLITYFLACTLSKTLFGYKGLGIPWSYYQLLDREALTHIPFKSLYLLHSQPPLLNTLLALLIKLASISNLTPQFWAHKLFIILGLLSTIMLFNIVFKVTNSLVAALIAIVLTLTNPAYYFFQHMYFYPFILHFLLIFLLRTVIVVIETENQGTLILSAIILAFICNTRSLFHPVWAISIYTLTIATLYLIQRGQKVFKIKSIIYPTLVLGIFLFIWPLKNYFLFQEFTFSTWGGYNLARSTSVHSDQLYEYLSTGKIPKEIAQEIIEFQQKHDFADEAVFVIAKAEKTDGSRNWNHFILTKINKSLKNKALRSKLTDPKQWLTSSLSNYLAWTRPSYVHPYTGKIRGPKKNIYIKYAQLYSKLFFYDFRPFLEKNISILSDYNLFYLRNTPLPFTVFGILIFPSIMLISLIISIGKLRKKQYFEFAILMIPWFTLFWLVLVPSLTDGIEGNRMRFSATSSYLIIMTILVLKELYKPGNLPNITKES